MDFIPVLTIMALTVSIIALPFLFFKPHEHQTFFFGYALVMLTHFVAAYLQSNNYLLPGADEDAMRFNLYATQVMLSGEFKPLWVGANLYDNLLGIIYTIVGRSLFIGCLTSIFAFCLGYTFIYRLLQKALPSESHLLIDLYTVFFAILPSTIIFTSVTMREPWELLFAIGCVYYSYLCIIETKLKHVIWLFIFSILMLFIHNAFYLYCIFLPLAFLLPFNLNTDDNDKRFFAFPKLRVRILLLVALLATTILLPIILENISPVFNGLRLADEIMGGNVTSYTSNYRTSISYARSDYGVRLETFDARAFVSSLSKMVLSYLFRPLPNEIENVKDTYAFMECLLRIMMLTIFGIGWFYMTRKERTFSLFLGFHYGLLTFLWAVGTSNWGTAIRHHVSHQWLLVIIFSIAIVALYRHFKPKLFG